PGCAGVWPSPDGTYKVISRLGLSFDSAVRGFSADLEVGGFHSSLKNSPDRVTRGASACARGAGELLPFAPGAAASFADDCAAAPAAITDKVSAVSKVSGRTNGFNIRAFPLSK